MALFLEVSYIIPNAHYFKAAFVRNHQQISLVMLDEFKACIRYFLFFH